MICNIKKHFYCNNYSSYEVYIPDYVRFICKPGELGDCGKHDDAEHYTAVMRKEDYNEGDFSHIIWGADYELDNLVFVEMLDVVAEDLPIISSEELNQLFNVSDLYIHHYKDPSLEELGFNSFDDIVVKNEDGNWKISQDALKLIGNSRKQYGITKINSIESSNNVNILEFFWKDPLNVDRDTFVLETKTVSLHILLREWKGHSYEIVKDTKTEHNIMRQFHDKIEECLKNNIV